MSNDLRVYDYEYPPGLDSAKVTDKKAGASPRFRFLAAAGGCDGCCCYGPQSHMRSEAFFYEYMVTFVTSVFGMLRRKNVGAPIILIQLYYDYLFVIYMDILFIHLFIYYCMSSDYIS